MVTGKSARIKSKDKENRGMAKRKYITHEPSNQVLAKELIQKIDREIGASKSTQKKNHSILERISKNIDHKKEEAPGAMRSKFVNKDMAHEGSKKYSNIVSTTNQDETSDQKHLLSKSTTLNTLNKS
jgi:hypothetical protein